MLSLRVQLTELEARGEGASSGPTACECHVEESTDLESGGQAYSVT